MSIACPLVISRTQSLKPPPATSPILFPLHALRLEQANNEDTKASPTAGSQGYSGAQENKAILQNVHQHNQPKYPTSAKNHNCSRGSGTALFRHFMPTHVQPLNNETRRKTRVPRFLCSAGQDMSPKLYIRYNYLYRPRKRGVVVTH
jgi:hypothetical protein